MRCLYCHNPDTWCGGGTQYEASELIKKVVRNRPFYETGGITASGGEPMLQLDFLLELFSLAKKEGISTCLDTSGIVFNRGNVSLLEKIDKLLSVCDLVMLDIKHIDENEHIKLTGRSNKSVLDFARYLNEKGVKMRVRHVIVPKITFLEEQLSSLGAFLSSFDNVEKIEVLPFHQLGRVKYESLGIDPKTKTLLFSNGLNFAKAQDIYDYFEGKINVSFGIGTYISNDTCEDALNIVIKLQYVNGHPVAKLSDNPGKAMCQDDSYLSYLKNAVEYRLKEGI